MRASVRFVLPHGGQVDLGHGDLIGRLGAARLCLDDPSVSEAHAMVSLRGQELLLLGLRGRFVTDGEPLSKLVLAPGQKIRLSRRTTLTVAQLSLPEHVLALTGEGLGRQVLAGVCSLTIDPTTTAGVRLTPRFEPAAAAWIFNIDGAWRVSWPDRDPTPLSEGDELTIGGRTLRAVAVGLTTAGQRETRADGGIRQPLDIVARWESVHIRRGDEPVVVLTGLSARIISELVATGLPTPWEAVAREVWSEDEAPPADLRGRFDAAMLRLRKKLRAAGIRDDLVRTDGHGSVELIRAPGDVIEDQS